MSRCGVILQEIYTEIMSEARRWEESGNEYEDTRELGVSEGLLLASEIVKNAMKTIPERRIRE